MRGILLSVWVGVGCLAGSESLAGFINNKTQWDSLSPDEKEGLVMGAYDVWTGTRFEPMFMQYIEDVNACVMSMGLNSGGLIEIVDSEYRDLSMWERPPFALLLTGLRKVCLPHVNRLRAGRGEAPLD